MKTLSTFEYLIKYYDVKVKDIADYLHVDITLVSKWKSNNRPIKSSSSYLTDLCEFFLIIDKTQGRLRSILLGFYPNLTELSTEQLLQRFLTDTEIISTNKGGIAESIESFFSDDNTPKISYIKYFYKQLETVENQKIYFSFFSNLKIFVHNKNYLQTLIQILTKLSQQNNQLILIFNADLETSDLLLFFSRILNSISFKSCTIHFSNTLMLNELQYCCFLCPNVIGFKSLYNKETQTYHNSIHNNLEYLEFDYIFLKTLISTGHTSTISHSLCVLRNFENLLLPLLQNNTCLYLVSNMPSLFTYQKDLFLKVLHFNNLNDELVNQAFQLYEEIHKGILLNESIHYLNLDLLKESFTCEYTTNYEFACYLGRPLNVPRSIIMENLKYFLFELAALEKFNLCLIDSAFLKDFNCICKRNFFYLANSTTNVEIAKYSSDIYVISQASNLLELLFKESLHSKHLITNLLQTYITK